MKTYSEKLKDPRWQRKRLEVMQKANWCCQSCRAKHDTLHVHHKAYRKCQPWEYYAEELMCLCEPCHERLEAYKKAINAILQDLYPLDLSWVLKTLRDHFVVSEEITPKGEPTRAELDAFFENLRAALDPIKQ